MLNGKTNLSIFVLFAVVVGIAFSTHATRVTEEIDQLAFQSVVVKGGEVAGAFEAAGPVSVTVANGETEEKIVINLEAGQTVLDLLKKAEENGKISLKTEAYDFGTLITEVNGLKEGTDGKYWLYYVNGETPAVGVDAYRLQAGDSIELKFEKL